MAKTTVIKVIIFDYYGVIIQDFFWNDVRDLEIKKGNSAHIRKLSDDVNLSHISWDEFCAEVSKDIGVPVDEVKHRYEDQKVNQSLIPLIKMLGEKYRVVLLTNANGSQIKPKMDSLGLTPLFERVFVSSEIGLLKPAPGIYEFVANSLNVQPEECLMVDDSAGNVDGAVSVGMRGIIYEETSSFSEQLNKELTS